MLVNDVSVSRRHARVSVRELAELDEAAARAGTTGDPALELRMLATQLAIGLWKAPLGVPHCLWPTSSARSRTRPSPLRSPQPSPSSRAP